MGSFPLFDHHSHHWNTTASALSYVALSDHSEYVETWGYRTVIASQWVHKRSGDFHSINYSNFVRVCMYISYLFIVKVMVLSVETGLFRKRFRFAFFQWLSGWWSYEWKIPIAWEKRDKEGCWKMLRQQQVCVLFCLPSPPSALHVDFWATFIVNYFA